MPRCVENTPSEVEFAVDRMLESGLQLVSTVTAQWDACGSVSFDPFLCQIDACLRL